MQRTKEHYSIWYNQIIALIESNTRKMFCETHPELERLMHEVLDGNQKKKYQYIANNLNKALDQATKGA